MQKILITGASGFIGSFLVEKGLELGFEVWAGIRQSSSRNFLTDSRIHFIDLNLSNLTELQKSLENHVAKNGSFDYVIHAAGVTKVRTREDFYRINTIGTICFAEMLLKTGALQANVGRFVFVSSLSVFGPIHENDNASIGIDDTPQPNTYYGRSKLKAEQELANIKGLNYVILRPTGVYGPREQDYMMMIKSIKNHIDFSVANSEQFITFVYVKDLAQAVFLALSKGKNGKAYFVSDGEKYTSRDFSDLIQKELNVKFVIRLKAPLVLLKWICYINEKLTRKATTLNSDKYLILKQRNWQCDISSTIKELGYTPQYSLSKGVKETIDWYLKHS